jgi:glycosyltransferase involved in cell wall biosynthesis
LSLRICLVTAEFHGLFKNGGIGTANTGLATALAVAGCEVTVAYVDPGGWATLAQNETFLAQRARWREQGICLDFIPRWPRLKTAVEDYCWAVSTLEYLRARRFDVVLFNECGGQGYFALLAKRAGLFPGAPRMIVVTHGASDWARELNAQLAGSHRVVALSFFERRSVELADLVVSPSRYLIDWMRGHGWRLPAQVETLQNIVPAASPDVAGAPASKIDEIVFFGRLESRKGVEIFCDAISELDRAGKLGAAAVTFLGKFSRVGSVHSGVFLVERSKGWSVAPRFLVDLGQEEALAYLQRPGVLAVMPSLAENSPCVVVECAMAGVPFVATDSGGTAELIAEVDRSLCLAAPDARAIAAKIAETLARGPSRARLAETQSDIRARWRALIEQVTTAPPPAAAAAARVSVCITVPAGSEIEALTLESIRRQTHANLEIVIAAYGADSDQRERAVAGAPETRIACRSPDRAAARNAAAAAGGDWLMFARERDFQLEPHAVAALLAAAGRLRAEAVCGLAYEHRRPGAPVADWDGEIGALPFGPCAALAPFENCLGDDVFLISRRAFESLGGYESGVGAAIEDRLLLTRAIAAGVSLDLAPAPLAWRRASERAGEDAIGDMRRVLAVFRNVPIAAFSHVLESVLQGPYQVRARAAAWLAPLDETARDLALKLTFQYPAGAPESFGLFLRYCLARGRLNEAVDFARLHDPAALTPIAEAAVAREAERLARQSLREAARRHTVSVSAKGEIIDRLRLISAPRGVTIQRDEHCVASFRLVPGLTIAKAPLACPPGAERLESWVDFAADYDLQSEIALAAAEPFAQAVLTDAEPSARGGFWWSGWRRAATAGVRIAVENLPASSQPLDIFLLCRTPLTARDEAWTVWRDMTARVSLSGLATPSGVQTREIRRQLPPHLLERAELLTDASDFPYPAFVPGEFIMHHPLPGRISLVRIRGAVPPGVNGVNASFSVENERAHPIAFGFWIREAGAPAFDEASLAGSGAASGWTLCAKPFQSETGEARLAAPAAAAMDLYLATKVVGFDDVAWCHAYWREIAVLESLTA